MRSEFDSKDPAGAQIASFVCADEMGGGETINSVAVTISVLSGVDSSPASMLYQAATISGSTVFQPFRGGIDGVTYLLRAEITLSSGRVLVGAGVLPVKAI